MSGLACQQLKLERSVNHSTPAYLLLTNAAACFCVPFDYLRRSEMST
jgi:hypothetical protein